MNALWQSLSLEMFSVNHGYITALQCLIVFLFLSHRLDWQYFPTTALKLYKPNLYFRLQVWLEIALSNWNAVW